MKVSESGISFCAAVSGAATSAEERASTAAYRFIGRSRESDSMTGRVNALLSTMTGPQSRDQRVAQQPADAARTAGLTVMWPCCGRAVTGKAR